jgi:molybdopterin converting factor subunit 1
MRVKLFAALREKAGTGELPVDLPEGATVADLAAALAKAIPEAAPLLVSVRYAVNCAFAGPGTVIGQNDEVAVIPPVSGG